MGIYFVLILLAVLFCIAVLHEENGIYSVVAHPCHEAPRDKRKHNLL